MTLLEAAEYYRGLAMKNVASWPVKYSYADSAYHCIECKGGSKKHEKAVIHERGCRFAEAERALQEAQ